MNESQDKDTCRSCPEAHACRGVWSAENKGPLRPVWIALGSIIVFLLPIATAVTAGAIARHFSAPTENVSNLEILAVSVGLIFGAAIAWLIFKLIPKNQDIK